MATFGNTTNPPNGGAWYDVSSGKNQYAQQFTMPSPGGFIQSVSAYFDLYSGSGTCYVCIWNSSGTLLASASLGSLSAGSTGVDAQHWHTGTFAGNGQYVAGGTSVWIGVWTPGTMVWTDDPSGQIYSNAQSGGPGSFSGAGTEQGAGFGVYATYQPSGIYINTGTPASPVWTAAPMYINTGTPASPTWTPAQMYVNTGTPASPVWTATS